MKNCPKCRKKFNQNGRKSSLHHIKPRRFFGRCGWCIRICRSCHSEIEKLIPAETIMSEDWYWSLIFQFLNLKIVPIVDWCSKDEGITWKSFGMFSLQITINGEIHHIPRPEVSPPMCCDDRLLLQADKDTRRTGQANTCSAQRLSLSANGTKYRRT